MCVCVCVYTHTHTHTHNMQALIWSGTNISKIDFGMRNRGYYITKEGLIHQKDIPILNM